MNYSTWLLAIRYLRAHSNERNISLMVKICFVGIFIGSCSLALVTAIMDGFEKATHEKMQGIHAHILLKSKNGTLNVKKIGSVIEHEFPEIIGFSPHNIAQTLIHSKQNNDLSQVVMLKAIDPVSEAKTSSILSKIIAPTKISDLSTIIQADKILIGCNIAESLDINIGSSIELLYSPEQSKDGCNLDQKKAFVGGIFKTGIEEFDAGLMFCSQELYDTMYSPHGADQIAIKLHPKADEHRVMQRLRSRFGVQVYSWKDMYPALVSALKLEKYVMFFILALITLVASMNMISLLFMFITHKRFDIAILRTMGMDMKIIYTIFVIIGLSISSAASTLGLFTAWIIALLLQRYPCIKLPDVYFVTHIPVHIDGIVFFLIFITIQLIAITAISIAIRTARSLNISDILRFQT